MEWKEGVCDVTQAALFDVTQGTFFDLAKVIYSIRFLNEFQFRFSKNCDDVTQGNYAFDLILQICFDSGSDKNSDKNSWKICISPKFSLHIWA